MPSIMKNILSFVAAFCTVLSLNAQTPGFRARIERDAAGTANSYAVYLMLNGTTPFTSGGGRHIATAQFPIAVGKTQATPGGMTATVDPTFLSSMTQTTAGAASYSVTVNPVVATVATANAGEHYFSVNVEADAQILKNIIPSGTEFKFMTVTFTGSNAPNADSVKLLNVSYRFAPQTLLANNTQCQFAIEDNFANEYTNPFSSGNTLFYDKPGASVSGTAGTLASIFYGFIAGDFNSWSRPVGTANKAAMARVAPENTVSMVSLTSNPITENTKVRIAADVDQRVSYAIVDAAGKMVTNGSMDVHAGTDNYDFGNIGALASGIYYLTAKGTTINATLKMSK